MEDVQMCNAFPFTCGSTAVQIGPEMLNKNTFCQ